MGAPYIEPGDFSRAEKLLSSMDYEKVQKLWTPEVIAAWQQKQAEQEKMLENM